MFLRQPISGISGLGSSATGVVEGLGYLGYFRDGNDRQEPIVLGQTLPGSIRRCRSRNDSMIQTPSIQNTKTNQIQIDYPE